jgi:hypothetical protein
MLINYDVSYIIPTFGLSNLSPYTCPAEEETQFRTTTLDYVRQVRFELPENDTNPNLGGLETIWNSSASHPPSHHQVNKDRYYSQGAAGELYATYAGATLLVEADVFLAHHGFLKGRNEEWEILQDPSFPHARIGQLFDRDYVWVVTQTMVSFKNLALWAVHNVFTYKVYPGFWGRKLGLPYQWIFSGISQFSAESIMEKQDIVGLETIKMEPSLRLSFS